MNKLLSNTLILGLISLNTFSGQTENESFPDSSEQTSIVESPTSTQPQLEDLILEEICALCEREGFNEKDPFCLTYNLKNIRSDLTDFVVYLKFYFNDLRNIESQRKLCNIFCYHINLYIKKAFQISHFELTLEPNKTKNLNLSNRNKNKNKNFDHHFTEKKYIKVKITNFKENFDVEQLKHDFYEAINHQKGVIIDLRDNAGESFANLRYLLSYFFNNNSGLMHHIDRKHEPFFGESSPWKYPLSKEKLKELIETIQNNFDLTDQVWKEACFQHECPIIKRNIAIIINKNSAGYSEYFTLALKSHYSNRVKVIGEKSAGELLKSTSHPLSSFPGLLLTYPIGEFIGIDGTRVEGVGIKPDILLNDEEKIINAAIKWVTRDPKI